MCLIYEINKGKIAENEYCGYTSQYFILNKQSDSDSYKGIGRQGIDFYMPKKRGLSKEDKQLLKELEDFSQDIDEFLQDEQNALHLKEMFKDGDRYEIMLASVEKNIPSGYISLGYDVCYPLCFDDCFSAVLYSMKRMELKKDLNENGLFDSFEKARDFLIEYAKQDFCDEGEYCICSILCRKDGSDKIIAFSGQ